MDCVRSDIIRVKIIVHRSLRPVELLVSHNGITGWKKHSTVVAHNHDLFCNDGSSLHCVRRERSRLFIKDGVVKCLITSVYDGESLWCRPVEIEPYF